MPTGLVHYPVAWTDANSTEAWGQSTFPEKLGDRALSDSLMKILPEGDDLSAFINHELHRLPND